MDYELEETELFWQSLDKLDALGDYTRLAKAVTILINLAWRDPKRALPQEGDIRIRKLPALEIDGQATVPLRLAYYLDEKRRRDGRSGTVVLLHVERYDEAQELFDGGKMPPRSH